MISFVDLYAKNRKSMEAMGCHILNGAELQEFAKKVSEIAKKNGMSIGSCAEKMGRFISLMR